MKNTEINKFNKLNAKQKRFVENFVRTGNRTQSYKEAGYNPTNDNSAIASAKQLLRNTLVIEYYNYLVKEAESDKIMSIKEVLERKTKIARGLPHEFENKSETYEEYTNAKNKLVKKNSVRNRKGVYTPTIEEQDKALNELYKMLTFAEDRQDANVNITIVDSWSEEDAKD